MVQPRYNMSNIVCGQRGTGKSTWVKNILKTSPLKNQLIMVTQREIDERTFYPIPVVHPKDYRGGQALIRTTDIDIYKFFENIEKNFTNGIIVIDEAARYTLICKNKSNGQFEPIPPLKNILMDQRKMNIDMYFLYHSVKQVPTSIVQWLNNFILFYQLAPFQYRGAVIPAMDELKAAKERVERQYKKGNHFYWECVKLD